MCAWIVPPAAGLIEPAVAPEMYIDGIGAIEIMGSSVRVYLMSEQLPLEAGGHAPNKIVAVKLVGAIANVPQIIGQLAACLWRGPIEAIPIPPEGSFPRLVR